MERHQAANQGQSQPGAAVGSRGRTVGLPKLLEDHPVVARVDADAIVADLDLQGFLAPATPVDRPDRHPDRAVVV